jgi:hypothetical protein
MMKYTSIMRYMMRYRVGIDEMLFQFPPSR